MVLDLEGMDGLTDPLISIYRKVEHDMLVNMASLLKDKKGLLETDPESWRLQQLQTLGLLNKTNLNFIKKNAGLTSELLNQFLYDAGLDGLDDTDKGMKAAVKDGAKLIVPPPVSASPALFGIMNAYQKQATNVLNLTNQTLIAQAKKAYIDIINKATMDVMSGFKTSDQALRSTIRQWAEHGIPALIDKGNKKWGPEGYVRMVLTTTANNTVHALQDERFHQWDIDIVEVSSHSGARKLCAPYQGKLFAIGEHPKYPSLYEDTSYGSPAGLFGINCGHKKYPFIPGISTQRYFPYAEKENEKVYKESQMQRAHERGIRKAKTRFEMHKAMGDEKGMEEATELIKNRQGNLRKFITKTGRTRRRDREQVILGTEKTPIYKLHKKQKKEIEKAVPEVKTIPVVKDTPIVKPVVPTPAPKPVVPVKAPEVKQVEKPEDYTVKHKTTKWQDKNGIIQSKSTVYAAKDKVETEIGAVSQTEFDIYKYYAIDPKGIKTVFNKQKDAKQFLLDQHLAEKGIIKKAPVKPAQPVIPTKTPDPEPVKKDLSKIKLMDEVKFTLNGKEMEGEMIGESGDTYDILVGKQVYYVKKVNVVKKGFEPKEDPKEIKLNDPVKVKLKGGKKIVDGKVVGINDETYDVLVDDEVSEYYKNIVEKDLNASKEVNKPSPIKKVDKKITAPKKAIKDLAKGDKLQFTDKDGNELKGTIHSKYASGKINIIDDNGNKHQIMENSVITHIPEVKEMVRLEGYNRIDVNNRQDVDRDSKVLSSMNSRESYYVRKYTSSYYSSMNSYLRFGKYADDDDLRKTVDGLQRVLRENSGPLKQDTLLFRQVNVDSAIKIFGEEVGLLLRKAGNGNRDVIDEIKEKLIGGAMEDKGFVSSTYREGAFGGSDDIKIMIHAPKGYKNGMFVEAVSEFSHEKEYIFNSGMKFDIHDVVIEQGQIILKVIPN